ncbi:MAG: SlyX family protein [Alphaproteobacteria bacterium]|nr:SlyX family protein [Alphaproteobacteria bacterium]MBR3662075.1 SlyX family protein [Alphaproteobacteria bacterium]
MPENIDDRFVNVEMALDNLAREIDDLNEMVIKQGKMIDFLLEQNKYMRKLVEQDTVKPLSEETPPPHY